jgi:hypothetical protein
MVNKIYFRMGFVNTPYTAQTIARPVTSAKLEENRKRRRGFSKTMTAEKVAKILNSKYNILELFYGMYEKEINDIISSNFGQVASNMLSAGRELNKVSKKNLQPGMQEIVGMFRSFIDNEEMNGRPGIPAQASLMGIRHRRGHRIRHGSRPSFVDTGIYKASFRAWVDIR